MKYIEKSAKSREEAIEQALKELNTTKDKVDIEVIEEGSKGIFNLFGSKLAKVRVTIKENKEDEIVEFLNNVFKSMKLNPKIDVIMEEESIKINVTGEDMGSVIGYRGETLDALQYLLSLTINKNHDEPYKRIILDIENYREKREETLKRLAEKTAYKVLKNGKAYKLEPMNPYERRIIHAALQGNNKIETYSEGEEPYRRIVVDIKK
ncbi:MAG: protein jag [Clostridiales bacterium]|nr:protein jag [Clostridiales bacterium]